MTIPSTLGCSAWWLPFRQGLNFFWCFTMARLSLSKRYPTRNTYLVLDLFSLKCSILKSTVIVCLFNPQFYNILQYGLNLCFWGLNPYPRDLLRHVSQILVPFALVNRTIFWQMRSHLSKIRHTATPKYTVGNLEILPGPPDLYLPPRHFRSAPPTHSVGLPGTTSFSSFRQGLNLSDV